MNKKLQTKFNQEFQFHADSTKGNETMNKIHR